MLSMPAHKMGDSGMAAARFAGSMTIFHIGPGSCACFAGVKTFRASQLALRYAVASGVRHPGIGPVRDNGKRASADDGGGEQRTLS